MPTARLRVSGMRDDADERRLQALVLAEPGVYGCVASHRDGFAEVDFEDDELGVDRLLGLFASAGFPARLCG
jgi:hypothetical protein